MEQSISLCAGGDLIQTNEESQECEEFCSTSGTYIDREARGFSPEDIRQLEQNSTTQTCYYHGRYIRSLLGSIFRQRSI